MTKILTIIVSYNFEKWIHPCLSSVEKSTLPTDILVIDNRSTDQTVAIIQENYPHIRLIANKTNLGFGKANNIGMQIALQEGYDAVFLLNQDAWISPDTLQVLATLSKKHPDFGILSPVHFDGSGNKLDKGFASYASITDINQLPADNTPIECSFINAAFWFIPIHTLQKVGGFSPLFYHYGEDKDYVNRLHFHQYKIGYSPITYAYHDRAFREVPLSGFLRAERVYLLSEFTNINYTLYKAFSYSILAGVKKLMNCVLKGEFACASGYIHIIGDLFKQSKRIYLTRKQTQKSNPNYLNE